MCLASEFQLQSNLEDKLWLKSKSNKFLPCSQMIDQTFRIKALKYKITPQNTGVKPKLCFSLDEKHSVILRLLIRFLIVILSTVEGYTAVVYPIHVPLGKEMFF